MFISKVLSKYSPVHLLMCCLSCWNQAYGLKVKRYLLFVPLQKNVPITVIVGLKNICLKEERKSLQAINAGEGVEKREPSYTVGGNAN